MDKSISKISDAKLPVLSRAAFRTFVFRRAGTASEDFRFEATSLLVEAFDDEDLSLFFFSLSTFFLAASFSFLILFAAAAALLVAAFF